MVIVGGWAESLLEGKLPGKDLNLAQSQTV